MKNNEVDIPISKILEVELDLKFIILRWELKIRAAALGMWRQAVTVHGPDLLCGHTDGLRSQVSDLRSC